MICYEEYTLETLLWNEVETIVSIFVENDEKIVKLEEDELVVALIIEIEGESQGELFYHHSQCQFVRENHKGTPGSLEQQLICFGLSLSVITINILIHG